MEPIQVGVASMGAFWAFELFSIEGHPLTVGNLITGAVLLILGYFLSKGVARLADKRIVSRFDVEPSIRQIIRRVIYYFCYLMVILFTLKVLNVPLTIFTVLGGALAIGFGFGSQNVVNNFISGAILMVERPMRVNDYIEIEGLKGTVVSIGIRSTEIRTSDNRQVFVPNSAFLEKSVINWTLSDSLIRSKVGVGVAYGSDPGEVKSLLLAACEEVQWILKDPPPFVIFADFGDSALMFETYFWIRMGEGKLGIEIESDLRFAIDRKLKAAGIGIPFPQRDLNINATEPLRVEIIKT